MPEITNATGMPRRTAQDTIANLKELNIDCSFEGGTKNGRYQINDWGPISRQWIQDNLKYITDVLNYPLL